MWFTNGYIAASFDMTIDQDINSVCAQYCFDDPLCKASYFFNKAGVVETCNLIHVSNTGFEGARYTCGFEDITYCFGAAGGNPNRVWVKYEVGNNICNIGDTISALTMEELSVEDFNSMSMWA